MIIYAFMNFDKDKYIQLIKYKHAFRNQKQRMFEENKESFLELLNYKVIIEDHIFLKKEIKYIPC